MKRRFCVIAVASVALCASAATNYVDCVNGVDADGRGGSLATAWRTLQYAADHSTSTDVILVAKGTYDEGGTANWRLSLGDKRIFKSIDGREKTYIKGVLPENREDPSSGLGCICMTKAAANGSVFDGFTICGGSAETGGAVYGYYSVAAGLPLLIDCVVSNCLSKTTGVLTYVRLARCLVAENEASGGSSCYGCSALNCVMTRNLISQVMAYPRGPVINCTFAGNSTGSASPAALRWPNDQTIYNSLFIYDYTSVQNGSKGAGVFTNGVATCAATYVSNITAGVQFSQPVQQVMSVPEWDFRLVEGCSAQSAADASYLSLFDLPEEYEAERYRDFYGTNILQSGTIAAGAVQGAVTPICGVQFPTSTSMNGVGGLMVIGGAAWRTGSSVLHSYYDHWPVQVRVSTTCTNTVVPFLYKWHGQNFLPDPDNSYLLTLAPAPVGINQSFTIYWTTRKLFVDKAIGNDGYSGTSATVGEEVDGVVQGPKRTIQAAVDAAPTASSITDGSTVIYVAEGIYDEGGAGWLSNDLSKWFGSNRVFVAKSKYIRIVASGAKENTVIMGAPDPDAAEGSYGMGTNAVRCVGWENQYGGIQGFTLTGGHTSNVKIAGNGSDYENRGAAFLAYSGRYPTISNCIITNNVGKEGGIVWSGFLTRSIIADNRRDREQYDLIQNARMSACLIDSNVQPGNGGDIGWNVQAYHCTIRSQAKTIFRSGSGAMICLCNSIVVDSKATVTATNAAGVVSPIAGVLRENVTDNGNNSGWTEGVASFVDKDGRDFRITSRSDAIGAGVNGSEAEYVGTVVTQYWKWVTCDIEGNPITFTDGKPTAGAYQRALRAVTVNAGSRTSPPAGTYVVEPGGSLTVTDVSGKKLAGFSVNGELAAADGRSYTITSEARSYGRGESVEIQPEYLPYGSMFLIR